MLVLQILFDCKIDFQFSDEKIAQVVIFDFILSANRHRRKKDALVLF